MLRPEPTPGNDGRENSENRVESDIWVLATAKMKDCRALQEQNQARRRQRGEPRQDMHQRRKDEGHSSQALCDCRKDAKAGGISRMYCIPLWSLGSDGRSSTVVWNTKKVPSKTCRTQSAMSIYYLPSGGTVRRQPWRRQTSINYSEWPHYGETRY